MSRRLQVWVILCLGFCFGVHASEYDFKGHHFLASYLECDEKALSDVDSLEKALQEAARASGATILNVVSHRFPPDGLTMVVLLSESHASIHTYPEHRACFVDLFTCGTKCSSIDFDKVLRAYLRPGIVSECLLGRSEEIIVESHAVQRSP